MELATAFFLGLVGSLHCAGMCGPLALALPAAGRGVSFFTGRLAYNLGRIVTYAIIGLIFGLAGKSLLLAGVQRWVSIGLGILLMAGLFASRKLVVWNPAVRLVSGLKGRMSHLLKQRSFQALAMLGLLNGLLPCGLVYVAAVGAVATGSPLKGAEYMVAFGAGTVPMMLALSLSGKLIPMGLRLKMLKAVPVAVFLVASLLILRGMSLGIPYVSPNLTPSANSEAPACCHTP